MKLVLLGLFFLSSCVLGPTKVKNEVGGTLPDNSVWVDTRSALEYNSFHVQGSVGLNTSDYLVLKDAKTQRRILDPDLDQIVERLARRGISDKKLIVLLGSEKESVENKKWHWLLSQLGVTVVKDTFENFHKAGQPRPMPEREDVWEVKNKKEILEKASDCFVNWSEKCS